jgi:hypothetical protein
LQGYQNHIFLDHKKKITLQKNKWKVDIS